MNKFRIPTPQDLIKGLRGFFSVGYMDNARENIIPVTPENPLPVEVSGGINISNLTNVDWESTWFEDLDAGGNRLALFERRTKLVDGSYTVTTHDLAGAAYTIAGATQRVIGDTQALTALLTPLSLESRTRADGVNWLSGPTGTAIAVPAGAKTMVIRPIASNAYFRFGGNTVTAAAPSGAVSDGSGSRFLFEGEAIQVAVGTATHYAVVATGLVEVDWWLS